MSIIRENLMARPGYSPYCGDGRLCSMPRTVFDGEQFKCPHCGWRSQFPADFIAGYKTKWKLGHNAQNQGPMERSGMQSR